MGYPSMEKSTNSDGQPVVKIVVDASEPQRAIDMLQAERRRAKLSPLSAADESKILAGFRPTSLSGGVVHAQRYVKVNFLAHALGKIAYELAFHWFGDALLRDPLYEELRKRIIDENPDALDGLLALNPADLALSWFWQPHKEHHLGYAAAYDGKIFVVLRIFDQLTACVPVSQSPNLLWRDRDQDSFIVLDARSGVYVETSLQDELYRLGSLMTFQRSRKPLPDPLA